VIRASESSFGDMEDDDMGSEKDAASPTISRCPDGLISTGGLKCDSCGRTRPRAVMLIDS
jgi:hypothetical protein